MPLLCAACVLFACSLQPANEYLDYSGRDDAWTGGVRLVEVETPKGTFHVWTKRVGNNPTTKVLLLLRRVDELVIVAHPLPSVASAHRGVCDGSGVMA